MKDIEMASIIALLDNAIDEIQNILDVHDVSIGIEAEHGKRGDIITVNLVYKKVNNNGMKFTVTRKLISEEGF